MRIHQAMSVTKIIRSIRNFVWKRFVAIRPELDWGTIRLYTWEEGGGSIELRALFVTESPGNCLEGRILCRSDASVITID